MALGTCHMRLKSEIRALGMPRADATQGGHVAVSEATGGCEWCRPVTGHVGTKVGRVGALGLSRGLRGPDAAVGKAPVPVHEPF